MDFFEGAKCAENNDVNFFASGSAVNKAIKFCQDCSVRSECLEYAIKNEIVHGIWGGTSERERKQMMKLERLSA